MQRRALVSAARPDALGDLPAEVREGLITFLRTEQPGALPRWRGELDAAPAEGRGEKQVEPATVARDSPPASP
jgi:hypothetical protein